MSEAAARRLCTRALGHVSEESAQVQLTQRNHSNTRAAANRIISSGDVTDTTITLTAQDGRQQASVTLNQTDDRSLAEAGQRLTSLVQHAPNDPELLPLLDQPEYGIVDAFFQSTDELGAEARADAAAILAQRATAEGLIAAGFVDRQAMTQVVANSAGLFAFHRSTLASFTATVQSEEGEGLGWAGTTHNDWTQMTAPPELADRAIDKARRNQRPRGIEPGQYTVVLEPTAVGNLLVLLKQALDARSAQRGRSRFSRPGGGDLIGEQVADERLSLYSDPADEDLLEPPFTSDGEPVSRTTWIEGGVLRNLSYSRYWADREGVSPSPVAGGFKLVGGTADLRSLIESVERGVLVTRFGNIQTVDPLRLQYTGLSRDGTFLIEDGQLVAALQTLRFNETILGMLNRIENVGAAERVVASDSDGLGPAVVAPPLVVRDFNFSGVAEAS
jgi:predicted Zn-dependent protease